MKFTNGYWLTGNGYKVDHAAQPYDISFSQNSITILATTKIIRNRGMTMDGPNLEITYSSTVENTIKVHVVHFKGTVDNSPKFELYENYEFKPEITDSEEYTLLVSGDTRVEIKKGEKWDVSFYHKDRRLTGSGWRSAGYSKQTAYKQKIKELSRAEDQFFDPPAGEADAYVFERLDLGIGECVYGFGEMFTNFVKNGQVVNIWNSDGGTCSEQVYKSIPFYLSSYGYGVLVNSSDAVSFEVGSEVVSKVSIAVPGEKLEYFIIGGSDLKDVLTNYTNLSGKPALPPAYSFGLWLSTSFTTDYNEETVNSFVDGMAERNIPLQVFHFDCFWMREQEWCNFEWDARQFPDPKGMLGRLKEKGLELCVWINPYVGQRSKLFDIGKDKGYFIKKRDGSVFQADLWQPGLAIVDFTNPEAVEWYCGLLKRLFEMGIRNIKTDFGERIPTDVVYHSGQDPQKMHNYYSYLYNKAVHNALTEFFGESETCLFARSATVGGQKFPTHWGGDCFASYDAMAETLRAGLSLCASGFGFFSHDIGGFEATATPDLYKRWCAFGMLSTHSRLHGNVSYRVPWLFDEESCDVLRFYTNLKGRLMPYLYSEAVKTHKTGIPMMRAMAVEFYGDAVCKHLDIQYMLGESLMVVPIFNEKGVAEFYLPEGIWTDIVSGETFEGARYHKRTCGYMQMPILAREKSIIGFGNFDASSEYDFIEDSEFVVYAPNNDAKFSSDIYDSKGQKAVTLSVDKKGNTVNVKATPTDKNFTVRLAGKDGSYAVGERGVTITV